MNNIKILLIAFIAVVLHARAFAQNKPPIGLETYKTWTTVSGGGLSNNGNFVYYTIDNKPVGSKTFVIKAANGNWEKEFGNAVNPNFTSDNKYLIAQLSNDSLLKFDLTAKRYEKLSNVQSYELIAKGNSEEIMYLRKLSKDLIMRSVKGKEDTILSNVEKYTINPQRSLAIVQQRDSTRSKDSVTLSWVDLKTKKTKSIYFGSPPNNIVFDDQGTQITFMARNTEYPSLWHYTSDLPRCQMITDEKSEGITSKYKLYEYNYNFSKDGQSIFFQLRNSEINNDYKDLPELIISSYKDSYLQGSSKRYENNLFQSVLNIKSKKVIQLVNENEEILHPTFKHNNDKYFILKLSIGHTDESVLGNLRTTYYLCNTRNGNRQVIEQDKLTPLREFTISTHGKYVVYFDTEKQTYINYVVATGEKITLSKNDEGSMLMSQMKDYAKPEVFPAGVCGWINDDKWLLIQGIYDIWCVDPLAKTKSINLTSGIGAKDKIIFAFSKELVKKQLTWNSDIIISTFNTQTKNFGFSKIKISDKPKIDSLSSTPYYIYPLEIPYAPIYHTNFVANKNHNAYLIIRQTSTNAPNYYYTSDLKNFQQISNNQPQKQYNWLTSELHSYTDSTGTNYQGILYKPENFDASIKYPIIYNYYEKLSDLVNQFPSVELPAANFSIPVAVSQRYLVFLADINSEIDKPGEGALRSLLAAANHLGNFKWVDTSKMGIAGHSFGGFETNYIITHTNIFKAAISGAAPSEIISIASDLWGENSNASMQEYFQIGPPKMSKSVFEEPEIYVKNSPLLLARNINTPLLLMHNQNDDAVPFRQSRQLFIMLRSFQKPVWWLNYRNEGHAVGNEKNALDYNTKALQFFDYYLKGALEPQWMVDHL